MTFQTVNKSIPAFAARVAELVKAGESPAMANAFAAIELHNWGRNPDPNRLARWAAEGRRRDEAVDLIAQHYFAGMGEQHAAEILGRFRIRLGSLGDVSLRELVEAARIAARAPEQA
jgi:hypothetical protein